MICVVLAAGYATRLYPLTENTPKPLLEVNHKTILDWLLDDIEANTKINKYVIISNHKFIEHFERWAAGNHLSSPIAVLDDGTTDNDNRLGAVRDIQFAIEKLSLDDDLLVIAGDNLLDFSLSRFINYYQKKQTSCVMRYWEESNERLKKAGVVEVNKNDRIVRMAEKPEKPFSHWCTPPFYVYAKNDLTYLKDADCNPDAPGSLIAYLSAKTTVHAMEMPGRRYDIGDVISYEAARKNYKGILKFQQVNPRKTILITGAAGFVGFHLVKRLLEQGIHVIGFDNINDYYDVRLKYGRLDILYKYSGFAFAKGDLADNEAVENLFTTHAPDLVVHLAAQAGVRYSITNPCAYIDSNIVGFFNILEAVRHHPVDHLLYASSSSVYGNQQKTPFSTDDDVSKPISLYAATKKSNELMAYTYSHLYDIPTTGLRFFTVYGPWGRPDMAYYSFTEKIASGEKIQVYNNGDMYRDFTYVDDIVQGIMNMLANPPQDTPPAKVYNIGNNNPVKLTDFIAAIENALGKKAVMEYKPMQPGDVYQTYADVDELIHDFDFRPSTSINEGIVKFIEWYFEYHRKH